ncbi:MAG: hypothetical protein LBE12_20085 [Planctomycetaceae bacterium]|nr:hypothetical protein [Planctomycetaceae bacterium]
MRVDSAASGIIAVVVVINLRTINYRELLKTSGTQSSRLHIACKKCRRNACVPTKRPDYYRITVYQLLKS